MFGYDPGFAVFSQQFGQLMDASGYKAVERVSPPGPSFVHQIVYRYRKEQAFPLAQIGHGIFACNVSTDYEWDAFEEMIE